MKIWPLQDAKTSQSERPSLKQLLLADEARTELLVPSRGKAQRRSVAPLG